MPGRSNGLSATRFVPLVDLVPQLADALLEALAQEGVAAYAAPSPGVQGPYGDVRLPDRPVDRVWVDVGARAQARNVLSERLPEFHDALGDGGEPGTVTSLPDAGQNAPTRDEETIWQEIVAGYDRTGTDADPPWPAAEDLPDTDGAGVDEEAADTENLPAAGGSGGIDAEPRRESGGQGPTDDAEDHYVPPPPPPLPRIETIDKWAWGGVLGGPLYLLLLTLTGWELVDGTAVLAVVAFVAGFVTLVVRMNDRPPDDSGPDNGAVV